MPKISVLMSVYNRADYVGEAIESVLNQTIDNWELVVINDGSTDNSEEVISRYASHLTYCSQSNHGMAGGLNHALRLSNGEYIAFLSSDDKLMPDSLENLSAVLDNSPDISIAHSDGYVCNESGHIFNLFSKYMFIPPVSDLLEQLAIDNVVNIVDSALTRRSSLEKVDGPFDEGMHGFEDWDLCIRLAALNEKFFYIEKPTFIYRIHQGQKSSPKSSISDKRRNSLLRSRLKLINSPSFSNFSLNTRRHVFYVTLIDLSRSDFEQQDMIFKCDAFTSLPSVLQSDLIYQTGVNNILIDQQFNIGKQRIIAASQMEPGNLKYTFARALVGMGGSPFRAIIGSKRTISKAFHRDTNETLPTGQNIQIKKVESFTNANKRS